MSHPFREQRERRGLTLRQASRETGIPSDVLAALEVEGHANLDPGGIVARYRRQYAAYLGFDLDHESIQQDHRTHESTPDPSSEPFTEEVTELEPSVSETVNDPVPKIRLVLVGLAVTVVAFLAIWTLARLFERGDSSAERQAEATSPPDQEVTLRAIEPVRIRVRSDGEQVQDGILAPRTTYTFSARDRLELFIPDLKRVRIHYNGNRLVPLGNQDRGRRLVFIDDEES